MFVPSQIVGIWFRGLFALALIGTATTLLALWNGNREIVVSKPSPVAVDPGNGITTEQPRVEVREFERWRFGLNQPTMYLLGGLALVLWSLTGVRFRARWDP